MGAIFFKSKVRLGNVTNQDSDNNAMLVAHAYECLQDGMVEVLIEEVNVSVSVIAYDDTDSNPAVGGTIRQRFTTTVYGAVNQWKSFNFTMQKGHYFEITASNANVTIRWCPFGILKKCIDHN